DPNIFRKAPAGDSLPAYFASEFQEISERAKRILKEKWPAAPAAYAVIHRLIAQRERAIEQKVLEKPLERNKRIVSSDSPVAQLQVILYREPFDSDQHEFTQSEYFAVLARALIEHARLASAIEKSDLEHRISEREKERSRKARTLISLASADNE